MTNADHELKQLSEAQYNALLTASHLPKPDEVVLGVGINRKTLNKLIELGITDGYRLTAKGRRLWVAAHRNSYGMTPIELKEKRRADYLREKAEQRARAEALAAPFKGIGIKPRNMTSFAAPEDEGDLGELLVPALMTSTTVTLSHEQLAAIGEKLDKYRQAIKVLAS